MNECIFYILANGHFCRELGESNPENKTPDTPVILFDLLARGKELPHLNHSLDQENKLWAHWTAGLKGCQSTNYTKYHQSHIITNVANGWHKNIFDKMRKQSEASLNISPT